MPRSAAKRVEPVVEVKRKVYGLTAQNSRRKELDDLGAIIRFSKADIIVLRDLCATEGSRKVAENIGVAEVTMLRVMTGLGEHCIPRTTEAMRAFLQKLNS